MKTKEMQNKHKNKNNGLCEIKVLVYYLSLGD